MSEFTPELHRPAQSSSNAVERVFDELSVALERAAFLYGNAAFFDIERARQIRRSFDVAVAKAESYLRRDEDTPVVLASGPNRSQRIEAEITDFIQQMGKPVTIDEVIEHLSAVSLGEPRASLVTRMSRMAASGKLVRSGRGYYELAE